MSGKLETGLSIYLNEIRESINSNVGYHSLYLANLCFIYWIAADLRAMRQTAEQALKSAKVHQVSEAIAFSLHFLGISNYHQNNLQLAEERLTVFIEDYFFYVPVLHVYSSFCLSLIYQAQGRPDKARERNEAIIAYAMETNNLDMLKTARAFEAELALRQGRLEDGCRWVTQFQIQPFIPPFGFYMPQLTAVKVLLAQNTSDSLLQAADLLDQLHDFVTSIYNTRFQIDVLALQAALNSTLGNKLVAHQKLALALALGENGGIIRAFLDMGPQVTDLIKEFVDENNVGGYLLLILAAIRDEEHRALQNDSEQLSCNSPAEVLTKRELETLGLANQRLSNQEIADQLSISMRTVKKHMSNIFKKLNVSNRRQAREKSISLTSQSSSASVSQKPKNRS